MKIKSLSTAVAIIMLAIMGSAAADEPGPIRAYKTGVVKAVNEWSSNMNLADTQLAKLRADLYKPAHVKDIFSETLQDMKTRVDNVENLDASKKKLQDRLAETQKQANDPNGTLKGKGEALELGFKIVDDIKAIDQEIDKIAAKVGMDHTDMNKLKNFLKGNVISAAAVAAENDKSTANLSKQFADLKDITDVFWNQLTEDIKRLHSPARDLEKDPATKKTLSEWGPKLAEFIQQTINGRKNKEIKVTATVTWDKTAFAGGSAPILKPTYDLPSK